MNCARDMPAVISDEDAARLVDGIDELNTQIDTVQRWLNTTAVLLVLCMITTLIIIGMDSYKMYKKGKRQAAHSVPCDDHHV